MLYIILLSLPLFASMLSLGVSIAGISSVAILALIFSISGGLDVFFGSIDTPGAINLDALSATDLAASILGSQFSLFILSFFVFGILILQLASHVHAASAGAFLDGPSLMERDGAKLQQYLFIVLLSLMFSGIMAEGSIFTSVLNNSRALGWWQIAPMLASLIMLSVIPYLTIYLVKAGVEMFSSHSRGAKVPGVLAFSIWFLLTAFTYFSVLCFLSKGSSISDFFLTLWG